MTLCVAIQTYFGPVRPNCPAVFNMLRASSRVEYSKMMRASESIIDSKLDAVSSLTRIVSRILNLNQQIKKLFNEVSAT
jgi:hypothetical protein